MFLSDVIGLARVEAQVLKPVIRRVAVDMMHHLLLGEEATKVTSHHCTVVEHSASVTAIDPPPPLMEVDVTCAAPLSIVPVDISQVLTLDPTLTAISALCDRGNPTASAKAPT